MTKILTLIHVEDMLWYDGPVLSRVRDQQGQFYFMSFFNLLDEATSKFFIWKVSNESMLQYKGGFKTLRETMQEADHMMFFTNLHRDYSCDYENFPRDLLPAIDSFSEAYWARQEEMA